MTQAKRQYSESRDISFGENESNLPYPLRALKNGVRSVNVSEAVAREWLLHNQLIQTPETCYALKIKPLGLGVYQVTKSEKLLETKLVQR